MHTLKITTEEYGDIFINHNSDWSGEVIISRLDTEEVITLPGELLLLIAQRVSQDNLKSKIISFIESI